MKISKVQNNGKNRVLVDEKDSPESAFETDDERTYFLAVLPVHPEMKERGQAGGQAGGQAQKNELNDTEKAVFTLLRKGHAQQKGFMPEYGRWNARVFDEVLE